MTNRDVWGLGISPSDTELALKQLSLREPSKALDNKVAACFREVPVDAFESRPAARSSRRSLAGAWQWLLVVAAVCLLLGVVAGRWSVTVGHVEGVTAMETGSAFLPAEARPSRSGGHGDAGGGQNLVINVNDIPEVVLREHFQAPAVAMLCSLGTGSVSDHSQDGCLACHQGLARAKSEFRRLHSSTLNSEVCATCHVAARNKPVNVFAEEVSLRPSQQLRASESPTG